MEQAELTNQRRWYREFERVFKAQELNTLDDLYKFIAFAYSWMPTIPSIHLNKTRELDQALILLKRLRANEVVDRKLLVQSLVEVVNHSVTGASKVMHFIAPQVPIIDSRVIRAWKMEFPKEEGIVQFPKHPILDKARMIKKYLHYWENMDAWLANCQKEKPALTMRDLESALYWVGGKRKG